jgi:hypothetical protein
MRKLTWKTLATRLAPELNLSLPNICDVSLMTCVLPPGRIVEQSLRLLFRPLGVRLLFPLGMRDQKAEQANSHQCGDSIYAFHNLPPQSLVTMRALAPSVKIFSISRPVIILQIGDWMIAIRTGGRGAKPAFERRPLPAVDHKKEVNHRRQREYG